jgi:hypothetical protein
VEATHLFAGPVRAFPELFASPWNDMRWPRRRAGTYGILDVLRHPSRIFRPPPASSGESDLIAVRSGGQRLVSCFLRASFDPYPRTLKQGRLTLSGQRASWTPYWSVRRTPQVISTPIDSVSARPADHREPNLKKGGTAFGVVAIPAFVVVTCQTGSGLLELVVPQADEKLVAGFFGGAVEGG